MLIMFAAMIILPVGLILSSVAFMVEKIVINKNK